MKLAIKTNKTVDITNLIFNPKFVVFFDASLPLTVTRDANNKISGWLDRSLNGLHATQTTLSEQPTYTSFNNFSGINFTSIDSTYNTFLRFTIPGNFGAINGFVYIVTDKYVFQGPITIPDSSNDRIFTITGGTNILIAVILVRGGLNTDEESQLGAYLQIKGANTRQLTSLALEFSSFNYTNPLHVQITNFSSFNQIDTSAVTSLTRSWLGQANLTQFPLINTTNVTNINLAWFGTKIINFPALDFRNVVFAQSSWFTCTDLTSFPFVNLSKAQVLSYSWSGCSNLVSFPAMDFRACTTFQETWRNCRLDQTSVDEILISIAAGLANNPTKVLAANGGSFTLTGTNNLAPGNTNRRSSWGANSWEFNLSQVNELGYNFAANGITGQQAKGWLAAKGWAIATN